MSKQEQRIQTNEEDFKKVVDDLVKNQEAAIQANEEGLKDLKTNMEWREARIQAVVDYLSTNVEKQDAMIHTNEEDFLEVVGDLKDAMSNQEAKIKANEDGLDVSICYLIDKLKKLR